MAARTGQEFMQGLRDRPRVVWMEGQRIDDVTEHPALSRSAEQIAGLYDLQNRPEHAESLLYESPTTGDPVATSFMVPHSYDDLVKRHTAFRLAAEQTFGLMGRSPDFLNTTLMALAEGRDVFERAGSRFAQNVVDYYEYAREQDLFLTHALITPQIDRSKSSAEQAESTLHLAVVDRNDEGLIVEGARMLATLAPLADEILIYNLPGLRPGDERHALVFALPVDTPGLRFICREPYERAPTQSFNHPLAGHFEESDALVVFDQVLVPWERVFLHDDVELANAMYPDTALRQHTAHQTNVRGLVKMQLAVGIAMALARSVKTDRFLHVQEMLGEAVGYVELIKAGIGRAEREYERAPSGAVRAKFECLQTLRGYLPRVYPRVVEILQILGAGGLMMMPSAEDFDSEIGPDVERYFQGADGMPAVDRVRLYKLAWDLGASAFGMRQLQYERYYAGDPVRLVAGNYLGYDSSECDALVQRALDLAGDPAQVTA